jgi:DNA repair photolyase
MNDFTTLNTKFKFGITERGDAGLDLSWADRIHAVECAIIISKAANDEFTDLLLEHQDKIIYHATCTGFGGTKFEPNVPSIDEKFDHIRKLIWNGFPAKQIVVRIDPLFPMQWRKEIDSMLNINYLYNIKDILARTESLGIERVRYSYLDFYPHVNKRFKEIDFNFTPWTVDIKNEIRLNEINPNLKYESCGEYLAPPWEKVGCISNEDLRILNRTDLKFTGHSKQRIECKCPGNKLELLNHKTRCDHKCVYCYWKD